MERLNQPGFWVESKLVACLMGQTRPSFFLLLLFFSEHFSVSFCTATLITSVSKNSHCHACCDLPHAMTATHMPARTYKTCRHTEQEEKKKHGCLQRILNIESIISSLQMLQSALPNTQALSTSKMTVKSDTNAHLLLCCLSTVCNKKAALGCDLQTRLKTELPVLKLETIPQLHSLCQYIPRRQEPLVSTAVVLSHLCVYVLSSPRRCWSLAWLWFSCGVITAIKSHDRAAEKYTVSLRDTKCCENATICGICHRLSKWQI